MRPSFGWLLLLAAPWLTSCSTLSYYSHVLRGGLAVLQAREPIAEVLADPARDPRLKLRLQRVQAARSFAAAQLALPDNNSYSEYSELHRPFVVFNVFAASELSLTPVTHCFLVAGCVAYRGYYDEARARAEATRLQALGLETYVGGVAAYSTLGWFDDPVLSTMLRWGDERLAATVFHELAHQVAYVQDDTAFNESYSKFVELEGLKAWRQARGLPPELPAEFSFETLFIDRMMQTRTELEAVYASDRDEAAKRIAKAEAFARLEHDVRKLDGDPQAQAGSLGFFATPMNNAKLLPFGLYHQWQAAFGVLFQQQDADWQRFHRAVKALAALAAPRRLQQLKSLQAQADAPLP